MDWIWLILNVVLFFLIGLFLKKYLPSYMDEKGKNLATKEDVAEITRKTEEVQKEFKETFEQFSLDLHFKYDFHYKQYSMLYCKLYAIIIQSEYVRHFLYLTSEEQKSFEEEPFLEIPPSLITKQDITFDTGMPVVKTQIKKQETSISKFSKKELCNYIIENGEYASQKLLKLAISYRFAYHFSTSNPETQNSSCEDVANGEETRLIKEMVCCIVSEYNMLKRELKMEYDSEELENGIFKI